MADHVEKLWVSYRDKVLPKTADQIQVLETKRAFFAGALSLLNAVTGDGFMDPEAEPTAADERRMEEIQDELDAFGRSGGLI